MSPAVNLPFDESLMITESKGWADDKSAYSEISKNNLIIQLILTATFNESEQSHRKCLILNRKIFYSL